MIQRVFVFERLNVVLQFTIYHAQTKGNKVRCKPLISVVSDLFIVRARVCVKRERMTDCWFVVLRQAYRS